jgi:hypothetical protein
MSNYFPTDSPLYPVPLSFSHYTPPVPTSLVQPAMSTYRRRPGPTYLYLSRLHNRIDSASHKITRMLANRRQLNKSQNNRNAAPQSDAGSGALARTDEHLSRQTGPLCGLQNLTIALSKSVCYTYYVLKHTSIVLD